MYRTLKCEIARREAAGQRPSTAAVAVNERAEVVEGDADTWAWSAVRMAEERIGRRLTADELRRRAAEQRRFADAMDRIAEQREPRTTYTIDEILEEERR